MDNNYKLRQSNKAKIGKYSRNVSRPRLFEEYRSLMNKYIKLTTQYDTVLKMIDAKIDLFTPLELLTIISIVSEK